MSINCYLDNEAAPRMSNVEFAGSTGDTWRFRSVVAPPPPNPPNDPDAMNTIVGKFASHTCGAFSTNNGQDFAAVFGRMEGSNDIIEAWPFRPMTSVGFSIPGNKHYGGIIRMPANPGTTRHGLHGDPYGGSCGMSATRVFCDWSVVGVGDTPNPTGVCSGAFAFDGSTFVTFNPSADVAHDNPALCNLRPSGTYRVIIKPRSTTPTFALLTFI
jgi:hypothetical protein